MLTKEQAIAIWGAQNLKTATPAAVHDLRIRDQSKKFLVEIGLPREADLMLEFDFDPAHIPTLLEYAAARKLPASEDLARYRRLGTDYGTELCLDEGANGAFWGIHIEGAGIPNRFVNSGIEQFAECLAIYYKYKGSGIDKSEARVDGLIRNEENEIRNCDPAALEKSDNWWACILEQMKDRLL